MKSLELDAYLKKLPNGLDSYPEMQIKCASFRSLIRSGDISKLVSHLPDELHTLVQNPPPNNVWIPTVHFCAVEQIVCYQWFNNLEEYKKYCYDGNLEAMVGPLYKFAVSLLSLERITSLASAAWPMTHKGSSIKIKKTEKGLMVILSYSPNAFPPSMFDSFSMGFLALAHLKGKKNAEVNYLPPEEADTTYLLNW